MSKKRKETFLEKARRTAQEVRDQPIEETIAKFKRGLKNTVNDAVKSTSPKVKTPPLTPRSSVEMLRGMKHPSYTSGNLRIHESGVEQTGQLNSPPNYRRSRTATPDGFHAERDRIQAEFLRQKAASQPPGGSYSTAGQRPQGPNDGSKTNFK